MEDFNSFMKEVNKKHEAEYQAYRKKSIHFARVMNITVGVIFCVIMFIVFLLSLAAA